MTAISKIEPEAAGSPGDDRDAEEATDLAGLSITSDAVRRSTQCCDRCQTRLVRRGAVAVCPRCEAITVRFENESELCEATPEPRKAWSGRLIGTLLDDFRLETLLGEGASGAVFLGRHRSLRRRSAVKVLSPQLATEHNFGARFLNEAQLASALIHPNVVTTHAVGKSASDELGMLHWIEQEFVPGRSLQDTLDRWRLNPDEATRLLVDVASGLAAAHRHGLVHRDIKPDNVLLTHCRTAKLGDFGLAKEVESGFGGGLVGTPNFMAPELFESAKPSPATDVFSLGVTFYTMLAGTPPFAARCGSLDELSAAVRTEKMPSIRRIRGDVSLEMAECLAILTDRSPANRPGDAIEALQMIQALLGHVRNLETLVRLAMQDEPCVDWRRTGDDSERYELDVHLPGGRQQRVYLEETDGPYSERNVAIDSVCGPVDPSRMEEVLRLNARVSHGAIAIKPHEGRDFFVMVDTYPRGTLDVEEVRRSVWELAVYADQLEETLTGDDLH